MPNDTPTLTSVFTDIADAIREKKGTSETYSPVDFAAEISTIEGGGLTGQETLILDKDGAFRFHAVPSTAPHSNPFRVANLYTVYNDDGDVMPIYLEKNENRLDWGQLTSFSYIFDPIFDNKYIGSKVNGTFGRIIEDAAADGVTHLDKYDIDLGTVHGIAYPYGDWSGGDSNYKTNLDKRIIIVGPHNGNIHNNEYKHMKVLTNGYFYVRNPDTHQSTYFSFDHIEQNSFDNGQYYVADYIDKSTSEHHRVCVGFDFWSDPEYFSIDFFEGSLSCSYLEDLFKYSRDWKMPVPLSTSRQLLISDYSAFDYYSYDVADYWPLHIRSYGFSQGYELTAERAAADLNNTLYVAGKDVNNIYHCLCIRNYSRIVLKCIDSERLSDSTYGPLYLDGLITDADVCYYYSDEHPWSANNPIIVGVNKSRYTEAGTIPMVGLPDELSCSAVPKALEAGDSFAEALSGASNNARVIINYNEEVFDTIDNATRLNRLVSSGVAYRLHGSSFDFSDICMFKVTTPVTINGETELVELPLHNDYAPFALQYSNNGVFVPFEYVSYTASSGSSLPSFYAPFMRELKLEGSSDFAVSEGDFSSWLWRDAHHELTYLSRIDCPDWTIDEATKIIGRAYFTWRASHDYSNIFDEVVVSCSDGDILLSEMSEGSGSGSGDGTDY